MTGAIRSSNVLSCAALVLVGLGLAVTLVGANDDEAARACDLPSAPDSPEPTDGATGVAVDALLAWNGWGDAMLSVVPSGESRAEAATSSSLVRPAEQGPSLARGHEAESSTCSVAIFEDEQPWGMTLNQDVLAANGISYTVFGSADMDVVGLSAFDKVIVSSAQPDAFYVALEANRTVFEAYAAEGGLLDLHATAFFSSNMWGKALPGEMSAVLFPSDDVAISDPSHPVVAVPHAVSDMDLADWNFSTHGYFIDVPGGTASIVTLGGSSPERVAIEVSFGEGRMFATLQPVEWSGGSIEYLENTILSGLDCAGGCPTTYDVYFGTDNPPTALLCEDVDVRYCDPGGLDASVTYYWQVVATDCCGETPGPVWSFTTEVCAGLPTVPADPAPADGAVDVSVDADLAWSDGEEAFAARAVDGGSTPSSSVDPKLNWWAGRKPGDWCATVDRYVTRARTRGASEEAALCAQEGACDDPVVRDAHVPDAETPVKAYQLSIHMFCEDDGTDCVGTPADVAAQVASLNAAFLPWRIQFAAEVEFVHATRFRYFDPSEEAAMKSAHADAPAVKLNVYVVNNAGGYSWGTFPWDPDALTHMGGIVLTEGHFGATGTALAHEVGHCLGLWHTHHGVTEVEECGACYESADGADGDIVGDRCSDTDPTPINYACGPPGGTDGCSGLDWGDTDFHNYMGYAPASCLTEFTPQQAGRSHCWTEAVLAGWLTDTADASMLYAAATGDGLFDFGSLDRTNGQFDAVGSVTQQMQGMAHDPNTDTVYATTYFGALLVTIDRATGALTTVGSTSASDMHGLAFDPNTDTLYGMNAAGGSSQLYRLETATGTGTAVGNPVFGAAVGGLAFDAVTNTLYGVDDGPATGTQLVTIDVTSGAHTVVGPLGGVRDADALAFCADDGMLYSINDTTEQLISIDPDTGAATVIAVTSTAWGETYGMACAAGGAPPRCEMTYDVFFGTDSPPTTLLCEDLSGPMCDPGPLAENTTYHWQVVATNQAGSTPGPVWSFTTESCDLPPLPSGPEPVDGATEVPVNAVLSWEGGATQRAATRALAPGAEPSLLAPLEQDVREYVRRSGVLANDAGKPLVVYDEIVAADDAAWLRLIFDDVNLGEGSFLRITSLTDGAVQELDRTSAAQWQNTSAYFNGSEVRVELIAGPESSDNRLEIGRLVVGLAGATESQCGDADDRVLSDDKAVSRILDIQNSAFTGWLINPCFLTAGHCMSGYGAVVAEFNVPLSDPASGAKIHPGPEDQYAVDPDSVQYSYIGVGNDWGFFGCFPNTQTGLTPFEAQGAALALAGSVAIPLGETVRVTGHGVDTSPLAHNTVQQTNTGPHHGVVATSIRHQVDTTGGSSGSPVIRESTGEVIGIHTNAGCDPAPTSYNSGTAITQAGLQNALANPLGVCGQTDPCPTVYDVYLGTDSQPTTLWCDDVAGPTCDPGPLDLDTTYYWQVVATNCCGETAGPVWSFTTCESAVLPELIGVCPTLGERMASDFYIHPAGWFHGLDSVEIALSSVATLADAESWCTTSTGGAPPAVLDLVPVGSAGLHEVQFDSSIELGEWTTVVLTVVGSCGVQTDLCFHLGWLPDDVNQDGQININDATAFGVLFPDGPAALLDIDGDGDVSISDATTFGEIWHGISGGGENPPGKLGTGLPDADAVTAGMQMPPCVCP